MSEIINFKVIKSHSSDVFEGELSLFVFEAEEKDRTCKVTYTPLMQSTGKPLYMALVEVRRENEKA